MAAVTAATTTRESSGSLTLYNFVIASVDTSTFATGLPNVIAYWAVGDSCYPLSVTAVSTGSTGNTFNLVTATAAMGVRLTVLART